MIFQTVIEQLPFVFEQLPGIGLGIILGATIITIVEIVFGDRL